MTYYIPTPIKESTARKIRNVCDKCIERFMEILFIIFMGSLLCIMFSLMGFMFTLMIMIILLPQSDINITIAIICIILTNIVGFIILNISFGFIKFSYVPDDNGKKPQIKTKPL